MKHNTLIISVIKKLYGGLRHIRDNPSNWYIYAILYHSYKCAGRINEDDIGRVRTLLYARIVWCSPNTWKTFLIIIPGQCYISVQTISTTWSASYAYIVWVYRAGQEPHATRSFEPTLPRVSITETQKFRLTLKYIIILLRLIKAWWNSPVKVA